VRAAAVVLSYGRRELGELLTSWMAQSRPVPLLVWLDGCTAAIDCRRDDIAFHRARRSGGVDTIGGVRRAAVEWTRERFGLGPEDAIVLLDDDDYYSPHHAARTLDALEQGADWTGALRIGVQWRPDQMPPEVMASAGGPGQQAAWAMRLRVYDLAGGYFEDDRLEDVQLAQRIGWSTCRPHAFLTHVRRQFGGASSLSSAGYDRDALRVGELPRLIAPTWRPELVELERWTLEHEH
jgi:hypothetical protein